MARRNPFANLTDSPEAAPPSSAALDYAKKGATRSLLSSIGELSAQADKVLQGETIVEIDPNLVDESFARDRFALSDADYADEFSKVLEAVKQRGQDSPVLVRPHSSQPGRYMLVFGHLRRRAAIELGRPLRAVVKQMSDRDHVIAQGQENNGRANTSFIEKALFAAEIVRRGYDDDNATVLAALAVDRATLSKMLAVASLPTELLTAIGRTKRVGRDRWYDLKQILDRPGSLEAARQFLSSPVVAALSSADRFDALFTHLTSTRKPARKAKPEAAKSKWTPSDGRLAGEVLAAGNTFTLAIKAKGTDARAFGDYLTERLDQLYEQFRQDGKATNGD